MLQYDTIRFETENNIARITLNRPETRNAFDEKMIAELRRAFEGLVKMDNIRAVLLTGEGAVFSAGADIDWMRRMGQATFTENHSDALMLAYMLDALASLSKPTMARVNGPAIGGGTGLVAACDIVVADERAVFSFSEVKIGLVPACIAPYVLRRIGEGRARQLFISGRRISAMEALDYGLVDFVATEGNLDAKVEEILNQLLSSGPLAIATAKRLVRDVITLSRKEYFEYTARMIANLRTSEEGREGIAAFLEKRKPKWVG
ncbi:MAG: enoyl-CoA hydratase/isomerase family protein [Calditrichaeota bacterium]|nr:enoyl-CoA hydratase/isomerase family protein [Calditrichota bacterium]